MSRPTWETSHDRKECPTCDGEGVVGCAVVHHLGNPCPFCNDRGERACYGCKGLGWVKLTDAEKEALGQRTLPL